MMRKMQCIACSWRVSFFVIFFIGRPLSSDEGDLRRRRESKKIITSDHRGFAGVPPTAMLSPPANIRSSKLSYRREAVLRRASPSSEMRIQRSNAPHPRVYYKRFCISSFHLFFHKQEYKYRPESKRRCCLSKHPAASVSGRGQRLGAVRR